MTSTGMLPSGGEEDGMTEDETYPDLRRAVREVVRRFPDPYWQEMDRQRTYPEAFVQAMIEARFLAALIPAEYGGLGLNLRETSVILEEVNRSGGNAGTAHAHLHHGHYSAPWIGGAEAPLTARNRPWGAWPAGVCRDRGPPSPPARTPLKSPPRRFESATTIRSTGGRFLPPGSSTRT